MNRISLFFIGLMLSVLTSTQVFAQGKYKVEGVVYDDMGPAMGVTVVEKGTNNGAATGLEGEFTLTVAGPNAIIEISYIGYTTQSFKASALPKQITLTEEAVSLTDVVVIGYGSQKKKEVTGSVASIKSEDFNAGVKSSPVGLLQGKVAGLNIIRTTSDPTSTGYNIQIRGFSTLDKGAGTSPLFIVDGVPVSNIDNISPNEIASMDVLKDGSAAAIYGTRGTNGVIIITTKRGDSFSDVATTRVEYDGYVSGSVRNGDMGMATAEEFRNLGTLSNGAISPVIHPNTTKAAAAQALYEKTRPFIGIQSLPLGQQVATTMSYLEMLKAEAAGIEAVGLTSTIEEMTLALEMLKNALDMRTTAEANTVVSKAAENRPAYCSLVADVVALFYAYTLLNPTEANEAQMKNLEQIITDQENAHRLRRTKAQTPEVPEDPTEDSSEDSSEGDAAEGAAAEGV